MLNKDDFKELSDIWSLYYQSDCWGTRDIQRMEKLESLASDEQLQTLAKKYKVNLDEEFA